MPIHKLTKDIITAAIQGFEGQKKGIEAQIAELRQTLSGGPLRLPPRLNRKSANGVR